MNKNVEFLSNLTVYSKYAKYDQAHNRRENYEEIVSKYLDMMKVKYPFISDKIDYYGRWIYEKKVLPSMRAFQFKGSPIFKSQSKIYNCAFHVIDHYKSFSETLFLLLNGSGVGFSVQKRHVDKLPKVNHKKVKDLPTLKYLVTDTIEGWSDALNTLIKCYFGKTSFYPRFDFSDIRAEGSPLSSGGKAPGYKPLKKMLDNVEEILKSVNDGEKLRPIQVYDIICHIADGVLAGGIRRAALICLFDRTDEEMLTSKNEYWIKNPQRARSNNSAVFHRTDTTKEEFDKFWEIVKNSGVGEPGIFWTADYNLGVNPCCFTGETKILTHEGYKQIKDCIGDNLLINAKGEIVDGLIWSNGEKDVVELYLSNKTKIKCTSDHVFLINDGVSLEAKDTLSKRLMPFYSLNNEVSEFTKYGFIQGDGGLGRLVSDSHLGLEINIGEKDDDIFTLFNIKKEEGKKSYYVKGFNSILRKLEFDSSPLTKRSFPKTFKSWLEKDVLMFLKGMYSANGCVISSQRISYKTTSAELAKQLKETLLNFNIHSYITTNKEKEVEFENGTYTCKESYDVNISQFESIVLFAKLIGFVHVYKTESLKKLILSKSPKVLSIKDAGKEEVFDFSLDDDTHWGVIEGVIAHNCEISLNPNQFCNLTTVSIENIKNQKDYEQRVASATFFGTLQAGFTDFHYLRPIWKKQTEKEALLGVSMTGVANKLFEQLDIKAAAKKAKRINNKIAKIIGINKAARITCIKPEGTSSLVLGTSSGVHAWHDEFYLRRLRFKRNETVAQYFLNNYPDMVEDLGETVIVVVPIKAPNGAITRNQDTTQNLLDRVKRINEEWIASGHRTGKNKHNCSVTVSVKENEWEEVGTWLWDNKESYTGISVLPYDGGQYQYAPFETITEEEFNARMSKLSLDIDFNEILEYYDQTTVNDEVACGGGSCEVV